MSNAEIQRLHEEWKADGVYFGWSTEDGVGVYNLNEIKEETKKTLFEMASEGLVEGFRVPHQRLPDYYHNLVLAEGIKGNTNKCLVKYLELSSAFERYWSDDDVRRRLNKNLL